MADGVRNRGLKHHALGLQSGQVDTHELPGFQHVYRYFPVFGLFGIFLCSTRFSTAMSAFVQNRIPTGMVISGGLIFPSLIHVCTVWRDTPTWAAASRVVKSFWLMGIPYHWLTALSKWKLTPMAF